VRSLAAVLMDDTDTIAELAGYLDQVAVDPAWRGRGLGAALLRQVLVVVARRGHAVVETEADVTNDASNGLLRTYGAERVGGAVQLTRP
jgi:ribosomal protein S18 acetylase RimI-like enzyme